MEETPFDALMTRDVQQEPTPFDALMDPAGYAKSKIVEQAERDKWSFDRLASGLREVGADPEEFRGMKPQMDLARKRTEIATREVGLGGETVRQYTRKYMPFGSLIPDKYKPGPRNVDDREYAAAVNRLKAGGAPSDADVETIALYEHQAALDEKVHKEAGIGTRTAQEFGNLGTIVAEGGAAGKVLSLGGKAGRAAGLLKTPGSPGTIAAAPVEYGLFRQGVNYAASRVVPTAVTPTMYVQSAQQKNMQEGRADINDPRGFAPAFAYAYANMLVLGQLQKGVGAGGGVGSAFKKGTVGVGELTAIDAAAERLDRELPKAWQTGAKSNVSKYLDARLKGDIEGQDRALADTAIQVVAFSAMAGAHGRPEEAAGLPKAYESALEGLRKQGMSRRAASAEVGKVHAAIEAALAENPYLSRIEAAEAAAAATPKGLEPYAKALVAAFDPKPYVPLAPDPVAAAAAKPAEPAAPPERLPSGFVELPPEQRAQPAPAASLAEPVAAAAPEAPMGRDPLRSLPGDGAGRLRRLREVGDLSRVSGPEGEPLGDVGRVGGIVPPVIAAKPPAPVLPPTLLSKPAVAEPVDPKAQLAAARAAAAAARGNRGKAPPKPAPEPKPEPQPEIAQDAPGSQKPPETTVTPAEPTKAPPEATGATADATERNSALSQWWKENKGGEFPDALVSNETAPPGERSHIVHYKDPSRSVDTAIEMLERGTSPGALWTWHDADNAKSQAAYETATLVFDTNDFVGTIKGLKGIDQLVPVPDLTPALKFDPALRRVVFRGPESSPKFAKLKEAVGAANRVRLEVDPTAKPIEIESDERRQKPSDGPPFSRSTDVPTRAGPEPLRELPSESEDGGALRGVRSSGYGDGTGALRALPRSDVPVVRDPATERTVAAAATPAEPKAPNRGKAPKKEKLPKEVGRDPFGDAFPRLNVPSRDGGSVVTELRTGGGDRLRGLPGEGTGALDARSLGARFGEEEKPPAAGPKPDLNPTFNGPAVPTVPKMPKAGEVPEPVRQFLKLISSDGAPAREDAVRKLEELGFKGIVAVNKALGLSGGRSRESNLAAFREWALKQDHWGAKERGSAGGTVAVEAPAPKTETQLAAAAAEPEPAGPVDKPGSAAAQAFERMNKYLEGADAEGKIAVAAALEGVTDARTAIKKLSELLDTDPDLFTDVTARSALEKLGAKEIKPYPSDKDAYAYDPEKHALHDDVEGPIPKGAPVVVTRAGLGVGAVGKQVARAIVKPLPVAPEPPKPATAPKPAGTRLSPYAGEVASRVRKAISGEKPGDPVKLMAELEKLGADELKVIQALIGADGGKTKGDRVLLIASRLPGARVEAPKVAAAATPPEPKPEPKILALWNELTYQQKLAYIKEPGVQGRLIGAGVDITADLAAAKARFKAGREGRGKGEAAEDFELPSNIQDMLATTEMRPQDRDVIRLLLKGHTFEEVARQIGVKSTSTAQNYAERGLEDLKAADPYWFQFQSAKELREFVQDVAKAALAKGRVVRDGDSYSVEGVDRIEEGERLFAGLPLRVTLFDGLLGKPGESGQGVGSRFRRFFFGGLPEAARVAKEEALDQQMAAHAFDIRSAEKDFRNALKETGRAYENLSERGLKELNDLLQNPDADIPALAAAAKIPPRVAEALAAMRRHIDLLSQKLIDVGALSEPLAAEIAANKGVYLKRQYQVFTDPKWAEKVPKEVRNVFKAWLTQELTPKKGRNKGVAPDPAEVEQITRTLLENGTAAENPIKFLSQSALGAKDLSALKGRKDIPPELRALWGEFQDPLVNYVNSVASLAHNITSSQFLARVAREGMGSIFFKEGQLARYAEAFPDAGAAVTFTEADNMGPLKGTYTTKEIKAAFQETFSDRSSSRLVQAYARALVFSKYAKTVLSPTTHARNTLGNLGFMVANGHWRLAHGRTALKALVDDTPAGRAYYRRLVELGIVGDSVSGNEMQQAAKDALGERSEMAEMVRTRMGSDKQISGALKKGLGAVTRLYHAEDAVAKVYAFENEKARYAEAYPEWSKEEVERHAANVVRATYPTYSKVAPGIKSLRNLPIAPFVSFPAEVVRTTVNTLRIAANEMRDPRTRKIGATRMAGLAAAAGLSLSVGMLTRALFGVTQDEEDALRRHLPEYQKDSRLLYYGRDEKGRPKFVDASRTDPHSHLTDALIAFGRGKDTEDGLNLAGKELAKPFTQEEMFPRAVLDVMRNEKGGPLSDVGGKVYNEQDDAATRNRKRAEHLAQPFVPGGYSQGRKVAMGLAGTAEERTGKRYVPENELLKMVTGQGLERVDLENSLRYKAHAFDRGQSEAAKIVNEKIKARGAVAPADLLAAKAQTDAARDKLMAELRADVKAAERLGMTKGDVYQILKAAGVSDAEIGQALHGHPVQPYRPQFHPVMEPQARQRTADVLKAGQAKPK